MDETKCLKIRKEHYMLSIRGVVVGEFELSELRHLMEVIDNAI